MIYKLNILSFITLVKKLHRNSVVLKKGENKLKRARKLGIGYNQYKRFLSEVIRLGLTHTNSRGDIVISNFKKVLTWANDGVINEPNLTFNRFIKFFNYHQYEKITFKNIKNQIRKELVLRNYYQQDYNIRRRNELKTGLDNRTKTASATAVKLAKKQGLSVLELHQNLSKGVNNIVSGKNHVANLIEMSPSTGLRLLRSMHNEKVISRQVNRQLLAPRFNKYMLNAYKEEMGDSVVLFKSGLVYRYYGSVITLNKELHLADAVSRVQNEKH